MTTEEFQRCPRGYCTLINDADGTPFCILAKDSEKLIELAQRFGVKEVRATKFVRAKVVKDK